jgi:phage FluMu protein Com
MAELSKFQAFVQCKCPRCRKGDIFTGNAYSFRLQKTNINCPHCNLKFEREPGFFYVAMFVSYAMNVAEIITIGVASYVLGLPLIYENLWYYVGLILTGVLLLSPINYRYSRVILLHYLTPGLHYVPGSGDK